MESIKQEIINNIYENGENLITGPVLQEVLLDMVDDVNDKVASASAAVPGDLVEKTGSWDDAADWVEQNSSSVVLQPDLDGYATEQWVENQGYLKEHQDLGGYATTESLNDLSESVANDLANLPEPDLSDYATKEYVEATSASVKEWVESKHYLTTASLSGSVTEETVGFMIGDATASVKTWVGDQNYATETFVSQAIAEIPGTDLTGYATEQWVQEQGYLTEHQDISGLATTQSVTSLSESVANDFANLDIPDVSGLATTESVTQLSESVAASIENLPEPDLSVYATTASVSEATESVKTWVQEQGYLTEHQDISGLATTSSVNQLSESVAQTIENLPQADLSGYLQTSSYLEDSASFDSRIKDAREEATTAITNVSEGVVALSASFDSRINDITGSDLSGYATTESVNQLSSSVATDIQNARTEASQAITGLGTIVQGESDRVTGLSASFDDRINNITGSSVDLSGYATTQSVNALSASFDQRLLSASGLTYQDLNDLGLVYDTGEGNWSAKYIPEEGTGSFEEEAPAIWKLLRDKNLIGVEEDENGWRIAYTLDWREWFDNPVGKFLDFISKGKLATLETPEGAEQDIWVSPIVREVEALSASVAAMTGSSADLSGYATTASVNQLSSSVATDILNARTEASAGFASVNQGVVALSASFDQRINDLPGGEKIWVRGTGNGSAVLGGSNSEATGPFAVAEGSSSQALGNYSHAEGLQTSVLGHYSHAEGRYSHAAGNGAHAEGFYTDAIGSNSHAEGDETTALKEGSHAEGYRTFASNDYEHAQGRYNASTSNQIFSIGVGDAEARRKNAISIITGSGTTPSASVYVYGVGSYDGTNPQPGTNDLASVIASGGGSGVDTALRNFLFGVESQTLTGITGSCTNIYSVVSSDTTLGFSAVPDNGTSLGIIIKNEGGSNATITLPDTVTVGSTTYNLITNGVDNSGSMSIPSGEYGDVVVTRQGTDLFVRTSINLEDIDINLSGYATTESVNTLSASFDQRISSIPGSDIDLSEYATTESVNTLSASFAETIDNIPTGSGASGNYLPITGGTLTGNLFVGGNNSIGVGSTKVGIRSLTVGDSATSTQDAHYGLAVGENCGTNVYGGVALGRETRVVSEPFGVATGFRTKVDKMSGFAGGCLSTASGQFSFAAGFGAVSKGTGQVVLGSFNEIDGTGTGTGSYAVILGNGKSSTWNQDNPGDVVRSNGLAIKWDGGIDINYSGSTITLQNKIAELEQGGGSPVDLSGYATTQSLNVLNSRVTDLSSSFDTRISQIVAASGGLDPADFAGAPTIVYQTDGTTGLVGVNHYTGSGMQYPAFDDTAWQLENLDLSNFDRIECYFKNSSTNPATIVTVILDSAAAGSGADTYSGTSLCPRVGAGGGARDMYEVEIAVDTSKTKLQVPYQFRVDVSNNTYTDASGDGNYLYKIVGYPKIV